MSWRWIRLDRLTHHGYHSPASHASRPSPSATMKLSYGAILSLLYCSAAASSAGHVFIYDPLAQQPEHREAQSVSPEAARLILAQRLGVSRYHSIKHANSELINQINTYGGRPQQFFRDSKVAEGTTDAHVLVWIEDVEDITGGHCTTCKKRIIS